MGIACYRFAFVWATIMCVCVITYSSMRMMQTCPFHHQQKKMYHDDRFAILSPEYIDERFNMSIYTSETDNEDENVRYLREWLESDGVHALESDIPDLRRQAIHHILRYLPEAKDNIYHLAAPSLWHFILHNKVVEASVHAKRFTKLVLKHSLFVKERSVDLKAFRNTKDIAFVLPFHFTEMPKIAKMLECWERLPPCSENFSDTSGVHFHFVWAYSGDLSTPDGLVMMSTIRGLISAGRSMKCFSTMTFVSFQLPLEYTRLDGACSSFQLMMHIFGKTYDAIQIMETDIRPLRPYWLEHFSSFAEIDAACTNWWVKGSVSYCGVSYAEPEPIDVKRDLHINGNALYALNCRSFEDYLKRIQLFYPATGESVKNIGGCETGRMNEGGYDHVLYQFRRESENFMFSREVLNKFQYSSFIANYCEDIYEAPILRMKRTSTYLVHSKSAILTDEMKTIITAYRNLYTIPFSVQVLKENLIQLLVTLYTGEIELADIKNIIKGDNPISFKKLTWEHMIPKDWSSAYPGKVYLWTSDFHSGPISCQIPLFKEAGAVVHPEVDFGNCIYSGFCKKTMKVLAFDDWKGFSLESNGMKPNELIAKFVSEYENDPQFRRIDAFICSHPVANCQLYIPFQKPIIIYATTRLEFGRHDGNVFWRKPLWDPVSGFQAWQKWIHDLQQLARSRRNVIAANNHYDAMYIKYFTGVDAEFIPSWCGDTNFGLECLRRDKSIFTPYPSYLPVKNTYLIGTYRNNLDLFPNGTKGNLTEHPIVINLKNVLHHRNRQSRSPMHHIDMVFMQEEFPNGYSIDEICMYKGMVVIPYQVSTMSIYEFYRLCIPMFFPSKKLIKEWYKQYGILWERIYGWPENVGTFLDIPDPNIDNFASFSFWVELADWYHLPHIQLFDSLEHLLELLEFSDLQKISNAMKEYNTNERERLVYLWRDIFSRMGLRRS